MDDYRSNVSMLPAHMQESIVEWIESPMPPKLLGSFLYAVLTNNLREAFGRADAENRASMGAWVDYLYNYAPKDCWGSVENVNRWHESMSARSVSP